MGELPQSLESSGAQYEKDNNENFLNAVDAIRKFKNIGVPVIPSAKHRREMQDRVLVALEALGNDEEKLRACLEGLGIREVKEEQ
jgi:endonuclease V-like protein UPF0215 family